MSTQPKGKTNKPKIKQQVRVMESRVASAEAIQRMTLKIQFEQMAKAEKLRLAAAALVKSQWEHRCSDKVGGCTAVSASKLDLLEDALKESPRFHKPLPPSAMAKVNAFLNRKSKRN